VTRWRESPTWPADAALIRAERGLFQLALVRERSSAADKRGTEAPLMAHQMLQFMQPFEVGHGSLFGERLLASQSNCSRSWAYPDFYSGIVGFPLLVAAGLPPLSAVPGVA
jgi:hypothetical protein